MSENGQQRDEAEIIRYYEKVQPHDMFGVWGTELLLRLPLEKAERFMKKDHGWDPETWERSRLKNDKQFILDQMEDYFQFAWEKALGHRGITASRSVANYLVWFWLLNDMELFAYFMDNKNYPNYGCPLLLAYAQKYEEMDLLPDNKIDREVFFNMARGQRCSPVCPGGCGVGSPKMFRPLDILLPPNGRFA